MVRNLCEETDTIHIMQKTALPKKEFVSSGEMITAFLPNLKEIRNLDELSHSERI